MHIKSYKLNLQITLPQCNAWQVCCPTVKHGRWLHALTPTWCVAIEPPVDRAVMEPECLYRMDSMDSVSSITSVRVCFLCSSIFFFCVFCGIVYIWIYI